MSVHNIGSLVFIYWYKIMDNRYAVYVYADKKSLLRERQSFGLKRISSVDRLDIYYLTSH